MKKPPSFKPVSPGVLPQYSYFNNVWCQTTLTVITGPKGILGCFHVQEMSSFFRSVPIGGAVLACFKNCSLLMEHSCGRLSSLRMSDRITTKLIGLSVSGIFFVMLVLNAITG